MAIRQDAGDFLKLLKFVYRKRLLELFNGTTSVSKMAEQLSNEVAIMDLETRTKPQIF